MNRDDYETPGQAEEPGEGLDEEARRQVWARRFRAEQETRREIARQEEKDPSG